MKTRPITRTRQVPHTIGGVTRMVDEPYTVDTPVPPRDLDRIILGAVTTAAALILAACVVWSTVSIGDLLARAVAAPAAYAAAGVFDLTWIICMAVEWLSRFDRSRAKTARRAGHAALIVAMGAVAAHGWLAGQPAVGIVGAAVSALAKGGWTVLLGHHAQPLDPRTQQWVEQQLSEAGGELALVGVRRRIVRARGLVAAEAAALGADADTDPDTADTDPDTDPDVVRQLRPSVREAVHTAFSSGIDDPERVLSYVRKVADPDARPDTVERYLRGIRRSG